MATSTDLRSAIEEVQNQLPDEQLEADGALYEADWTSRMEQRVGALPWWVISAVVHSVIFLLATLLTVAMPAAQTDEVVITSDVVKKPKEKFDPKKKRDIFKNPREVEAETEVANPLVVHEKVEDTTHNETANEMDSQTARGSEDAISDIPLGGTGTTGSLGVGGGGMAGAFGYRGGGGRKHAVARFGGSKATESAVEAALLWLKRHQEADGRWDMSKWGGNSSTGSVAMTGLATLAFLGAGYTHKTGKYRDNVNRAVKWLISQQKDNGAITGTAKAFEAGHSAGYCHAMGALALVEAYGMTKDPGLREAAQKTVDYSINIHQHPYSGWRYQARGRKGSDMSHTGWFVMQLKSAKVAGLKVDGAGFQGAMNFTNKCLVKTTGKGTYTALKNPNTTSTKSLWYKGREFRRTSISMVCRLFMGVPRNDPIMMKSAAYGEAYPLKWENMDFYCWYYGTLAMFQVGGDHWKTWNKQLKPTLLDNQRKGGPMDGSERDVDGSWDFDRDPWCKKAGRVYSTALGALCLEVYYRYLPMYTK